MLLEIGDRAADRGQELLAGDGEPVLAQTGGEGLGVQVAAVREQDQRAAGGADPFQHLNRARQRDGAEVGAAVDHRAVDVEDEPLDVVERDQRAAAALSMAST
jgi:hypothetical protein